jgi:hypothetical protein
MAKKNERPPESVLGYRYHSFVRRLTGLWVRKAEDDLVGARSLLGVPERDKTLR